MAVKFRYPGQNWPTKRSLHKKDVPLPKVWYNMGWNKMNITGCASAWSRPAASGQDRAEDVLTYDYYIDQGWAIECNREWHGWVEMSGPSEELKVAYITYALTGQVPDPDPPKDIDEE